MFVGDAFVKLLGEMPKSEDYCWIYSGPTKNGFHGSVFYKGEYVQAHRLSYELLVGPIPEGMFVLHSCDVGFCVNPQHLFLGTQSDNVQDMIAKGRQRFSLPGTLNGNATLDWDKVAKIRELSATTRVTDLAKSFNVTVAQIKRIVSGQQWRS